MRPDVPRLMIITASPSGRGPFDGLVRCMERALEGAGGRAPQVAVQLRAKAPALAGRALYELGTALRSITRDAGATLLVNGRADVAHAVDADGVHLPEDGLTPPEARRVLGEGALVGVSRHDGAGLALAAQQGADFATLSPFADSPTKGPALGTEGFAAAQQQTPLPVLALGGIDAETVPRALDAGAAGVAVIRAVHAARDPAAAVAALLDALDSSPGGRR